jgi:hypothetical protein
MAFHASFMSGSRRLRRAAVDAVRAVSPDERVLERTVMVEAAALLERTGAGAAVENVIAVLPAGDPVRVRIPRRPGKGRQQDHEHTHEAKNIHAGFSFPSKSQVY